MTELTMTELAVRVWEYVGTDPHTEDEIASMLVRQGTDPDVASRFTEWCAGRGYIRISPGTEKEVRWMPGKHPQDPQEAER